MLKALSNRRGCICFGTIEILLIGLFGTGTLAALGGWIRAKVFKCSGDPPLEDEGDVSTGESGE